MTVTPVSPPVTPADAAPSDAATTPDAAAPGSHFASLLQGLNGHAEPGTPPATTTKSAGRNPSAGTGRGAYTPADPVIAALLAAFAGSVPPDPYAGTPAPTPPNAPTATEATSAAAAADSAAEILAAVARASAPPATVPGAPTAPATATVALPTAPTATPPALADPALVAIASGAANAPVAPLAPAPAQPAGSYARTATAAPAPTVAPTATATPPAPANAPANAPAHVAYPAPAGTDVATNTAAAAAAGPNPVVRADPAPRQETVAENAMITAASAAVDHTPAAAPAAAASAPPAPAAPLPPPAAEQLVAVLRPLHRAPDGTYQLRIEMRPPELGRVDMRVEMKDGVLHASIHAEHSETADLVRAALDDLRSRLDADGVRAGQLTVDAQGAGTSGRDQQGATPERLSDGSTAASDPAVAVASTTATTDPTSSDSLLDVRI